VNEEKRDEKKTATDSDKFVFRCIQIRFEIKNGSLKSKRSQKKRKSLSLMSSNEE
jgi:hypothetical protein